MRFDSLVFVAFFVLFLAGYWLLRRRLRAQNLLILAGSYLFYGWWDWRFLVLIALSTACDHLVAQYIEDCGANRRRARRALVLSLVTNLGTLGFFKYYDFFATSLAEALGSIGLAPNPVLLNVALPVGISFYTFQSLAYTIDVYRGETKAVRDPVAVACYVAFFPQLVAGPIERSKRLLPQFLRRRSIDLAGWRSGITLVVYGLVKKIAVADNMAPFVDAVFAREGEVSGPLVAAGSLAFAFQIYADFSGYSDIARGVARLLGFELCVNFDQPYRSATPSEFWRRWHISLSSWLRDYLYISLGGNRGGRRRTYRNLMLTMVLGGLWHGAAWNFVLWGFFHGLLLCVYRALDIDRALARAGSMVRWAIAVPAWFALTVYGWLLFRAKSLEQVVSFTGALLSDASQLGAALTMVGAICYYALPIFVHHLLARGQGGDKWTPASPWAWRLALAAVILFGVTHARASEQSFIYFQF